VSRETDVEPEVNGDFRGDWAKARGGGIAFVEVGEWGRNVDEGCSKVPLRKCNSLGLVGQLPGMQARTM